MFFELIKLIHQTHEGYPRLSSIRDSDTEEFPTCANHLLHYWDQVQIFSHENGPRDQFHESKFRAKFILAEFLWPLMDSFLHLFWLNICLLSSFEETVSLKLSRIYSQREKGGKVSIKVQRNSTRRNFTLNFWLMKLAP